MDRNSALQNIREHALQIAGHVTAIHPIVPQVPDAATQGELMKALYELTKQVEVIKKHLMKLERRDDSTLV